MIRRPWREMAIATSGSDRLHLLPSAPAAAPSAQAVSEALASVSCSGLWAGESLPAAGLVLGLLDAQRVGRLA